MAQMYICGKQQIFYTQCAVRMVEWNVSSTPGNHSSPLIPHYYPTIYRTLTPSTRLFTLYTADHVLAMQSRSRNAYLSMYNLEHQRCLPANPEQIFMESVGCRHCIRQPFSTSSTFGTSSCRFCSHFLCTDFSTEFKVNYIISFLHHPSFPCDF